MCFGDVLLRRLFFDDCYVWLLPWCVFYTFCSVPGYIHSWSGNLNYCNRWGRWDPFGAVGFSCIFESGGFFFLHIWFVPLSICAGSFFASLSRCVVWRWVFNRPIRLICRFFTFCVSILGRWVERWMLFWKQRGLLHTWPLYILFVMVFVWVLPDPHSER